MSSSRDNSDMSTDKSSDENPTWDANTTPHAMSSHKRRRRREGTPVPGAREARLSQAFDTPLERKRKRNSKGAVETWSFLELLGAQNTTPSQKRKRGSLKDVTPNRLLSPAPNPELDQQLDYKKRVSFAGMMGPLKTPSAPAQQEGETADQKPQFSTRQRKSKTPRTPVYKTPIKSRTPVTPATPATTPPSIPKFPKLQLSSTYHSDIPKPTEPKPIDEDSFHDLVEENNELRMRVQAFEQLDDMILDAAAPIGAIAFSNPTDILDIDIDPVRQTLLAIERPAAEACLVILDKLTEAQAGLAASRAEGVDQLAEVDEGAHKGEMLMERIGLLEESNEVLGVEKDELTRLYLNKYSTIQEKGQQIKALVGINRRFKEIQASDREAIATLQKEVEDLVEEKYELEQQKAQFVESAEVYISDLQKMYNGKITNTGEALSFAGSPAARQSGSPLVDNRKAAQGLAGVMDKLKGNDYINSIIPLYPLTVLVNLMRDYSEPPKKNTRAATKAKQQEEVSESISESLEIIEDDDPCKEVKILLRENRINHAKQKKEWDQLSAKKVRQAQAALTKMTKDRDRLEKLNQIAEESMDAAESYSSMLVAAAGAELKAELKEHVELLANSVEQTEALQDEVTTLRAEALKLQELKPTGTAEGGCDSCSEVKEQLSKLQITSAEQIETLQTEINLLGSIPPDAEANVKISELQAISDKKDEQINNLTIELDKLKMAPPTLPKQNDDEHATMKKRFSSLQKSSANNISKLQSEIKMLKNISSVNQTTESLQELKEFMETVTAESSINAAIDKIKSIPPTASKKNPYRKVKMQLLGLLETAGPTDEPEDQTRAPRETAPEDDPCAEVKKKLLQLQKRFNVIKKRLKTRKKEGNALEMELAKFKAYEATPSSEEFEKRLKEITDQQRLTYIKRINTLFRHRQEQMFPPAQAEEPTHLIKTTLRDLLRQDGPPIKEISDRWFEMQWDELYDQVTILCEINYRGRSDHLPFDYVKSAAEDELISYYLRDTVLSENAMHDRINSVTEIFGHTYRAKVAVAIIFRILVEEIFNPIRFLLNMRFPDSNRWKSKLQFKQAFEELDNPKIPRAATRRGFQEKESWCTRQAAITDREVYRPSRQRDGNFNYFKQIEEADYDGNDNGKVAHQLEFLSLHH